MEKTDNLDQLVEEIFVKSFRTIIVDGKDYHLNPFNVEKIRQEIEKNKKSLPNYDSLDELSAQIKQEGGITRQTYETYHSTINAIARTITKTDFKNSGGYYDLDEEDSRSREISDQFKRLATGDYGEITSRPGATAPNIFGNDGEGTLFQRKYDLSGVLTKFRIFHQPHRNSLLVADVDLSLLQKKIDDLIRKKETEKQQQEELNAALTLLYDADTFAYDLIQQFNEQFGAYARINVLDINTPYRDPGVIIEFDKSHQEVAQRVVDLQSAHGIPLTLYQKETVSTLS